MVLRKLWFSPSATITMAQPASYRRRYCTKCGKKYGVEFILNNIPIPYCKDCGGIVKPDVVLYGENLDNETISNSIRAILSADTLIVGGTSLIVYPAAGLIDYFRGRHLILINKTATRADSDAELVIRENIGETLAKANRLAQKKFSVTFGGNFFCVV